MGFSRLGPRPFVGLWGLGVLLVIVKGVAILIYWLLPTRYLHGPIEITCFIVGFASILAATTLSSRTSSSLAHVGSIAQDPSLCALRPSMGSPALFQSRLPPAYSPTFS